VPGWKTKVVTHSSLHDLCGGGDFGAAEELFDAASPEILQVMLPWRCAGGVGCSAMWIIVGNADPPVRLMKKMLAADPSLMEVKFSFNPAVLAANPEAAVKDQFALGGRPVGALDQLCMLSRLAPDDIDVFRLCVRYDPEALRGCGLVSEPQVGVNTSAIPDMTVVAFTNDQRTHADMLEMRMGPNLATPHGESGARDKLGLQAIKELLTLLYRASFHGNWRAVRNISGRPPSLCSFIAGTPVTAGAGWATCAGVGGGLKLCGGCGMVKFCGAACAKEAWKAHKHKAVCKAVQSGDWEADEDGEVEVGKVAAPVDPAGDVKPKAAEEMSVRELREAIRKGGLENQAVGLAEKCELVKLVKDSQV
jgi:hypothetical protein